MSATPGFLRRADNSGVPLLIVRLVLGVVMILYAAPKIADPGAFLKEIENYKIFPTQPPQLLNLTAVGLPWVEMLGGIALIVGVFRRGSATLFAILLISFTVAIAFRTSAEMKKTPEKTLCQIKFDCGCGGGPVYICPKLAMNVGLILLAIYAMLSRSNRFAVSSLWQRSDRAVPAPASES